MNETFDTPPGKAYRSSPFRGLSARLLVLIVLVIMLAEFLIWAPSLSRFRMEWFEEHIASAELASMALEAAPEHKISDDLRHTLLTHAGVRGVVLLKPGQRVLVLSEVMPTSIDVEIDVDHTEWPYWLIGAFKTMTQDENRVLRLMGASRTSEGVTVEALIDETPLREEMHSYSRRILGLSLLISLFTAAVVYVSLQLLMLRPVRRLTEAMIAFREAPEDPRRVIHPSGRDDELGVAERELAEMQEEVRGALRQKSRLAALGGAVAKVNHDLRNSLATAMLVSDRLVRSEDPDVREVTPRLISSIDQAVSMCTQTLDYASDAKPRTFRRPFHLYDLVEEAEAHLAPLDGSIRPVWENNVPTSLEIFADRDQMVRVIVNLARNAFQAGAGILRINAHAAGGVVHMEMIDDGDGLPDKALKNLFKPFAGSARKGGTGLGLVIARDILRIHGGDL
ncbi:MAG: HAMP domain-containing histidine kinase, partial [Rhodospirillales bacterium]|nr:HAMP domain-containing histidine kinase [Rhodospirillales bacterium]MCW9002673.1 HAMP domain-containing histidine kinase [Rhodospirillales bacterium]